MKKIPEQAKRMDYEVVVQFVIQADNAHKATVKAAAVLESCALGPEVYARGLTIFPARDVVGRELQEESDEGMAAPAAAE